MFILSILLSFFVADLDSCYQREFIPDVNDPEYKLVQDEETLKSVFRIYKYYNNESYGMCIIKNWMVCNPVIKKTETRVIEDSFTIPSFSILSPFTLKPQSYIEYTTYSRQYPPLQVGDLNFDGITNYKDYAIWSKNDSNCLKCEEMSLTDVANIFGSLF